MNLAHIINKTHYVKMFVRSIGTQRPSIEMSMRGSVTHMMPGIPTTIIECAFREKDYHQFINQMNLREKIICECQFEGEMKVEEYLIELVPMEIHGEETCGYVSASITCQEFTLLKTG